jgi:hypothetical protein
VPLLPGTPRVGESSGNGVALFGSFGQPFVGYSQGPSVVWGGFVQAAFPSPPGIPRQIHLEADPPSVVVRGATPVTLRAEIRDLHDNVVSAATDLLTFTKDSGVGTLGTPKQVTFATTTGTLVGTNPVTTAEGVATVELQSSTSAATATVTATAAGLTAGTTQVRFVVPILSLAQTHRARPGRAVSLPLLVRSPLPVAGVQATVLFDPAVPAFQSVSKGAVSALTFTDVTKLVDGFGNALPRSTADGKLTVDTAAQALIVQSCQATTSSVSVQFSGAAKPRWMSGRATGSSRWSTASSSAPPALRRRRRRQRQTQSCRDAESQRRAQGVLPLISASQR